MKRFLLPIAAVGLALVAVPASAKAQQTLTFNNTCLSPPAVALTFCGSVNITASNSAGGTDIVISVVNQSGSSLGGDVSTVFNAIGIKNTGLPSDGSGYSGFSVVQGSNNFTSSYTLGAGTLGSGPNTVSIQALASTLNGGFVNSISAACSGSNARIYTCGTGSSSDFRPVIISFHTGSMINLADSKVYLNAATDVPGCLGCPTTTTPEPASIALFATGLLGMSGPLSRFRRRRNT